MVGGETKIEVGRGGWRGKRMLRTEETKEDEGRWRGGERGQRRREKEGGATRRTREGEGEEERRGGKKVEGKEEGRGQELEGVGEVGKIRV